MGSSAGFVIKNRYAKYKATTTLSAASAAATASGRVRKMSETAGGKDKNSHQEVSGEYENEKEGS